MARRAYGDDPRGPEFLLALATYLARYARPVKLEMRGGAWEVRTMYEGLLERSESKTELINKLRSLRYDPDVDEPRYWYRRNRKRVG